MPDTIKQGSTGSLVKAAQYMVGYTEIKKASGTFDAAFSVFVKEWQLDNGLTPNAIIDEQNWAKMASLAPTCSTSKNRTSVYTCAIQLLLGGLTVDGIYGTNTKNAVAAFQAANGLTVDGICGPKTWAKLLGASTIPSSSTNAGQVVSGGKILNNCVYYNQGDPKWGKIKYSTHTSSQTIANSGCGPTSMAMIMATFIDPKITPVEMCDLAVKAGYRTYDNGTAWGFYEYVFRHYNGFSKFIATSSVETLKAGIKDGALAVCSMNANDNNFYTKGGHFVVARGYDSDGYIYTNDPNNKTVPRKQKQDKFKSCLKQAFIFWPKVIEGKPSEPVEQKQEDKAISPAPPIEDVDSKEKENTTDKSSATGVKIIDISKWQGDINFDKVAKEVALVIVRASCGSDKDIKFDEYAKAMVERKIPFGVYCYSYAGTTAKAKDEAQKIIKYASTYKPLFYVMDAEESKLTNETIKAFANELHAQGATKIGCYVAHNHYKDYGYDSLRSLFDFTWIPRYGSNNGTIEGSIKPSYVCDLWQYSSTAKINGIRGNVDINVITGDGHDLNWFLGGYDVPTDKKVIEKKHVVKISGGNVNVRTEPNISGKIIGVAYSGDEVEYGGKIAENGWLAVVFNGKNGWLSNKYGKLVEI